MGETPAAPKMGEKDYLDKGLGIYQIASGATIEQMQSLFFDNNALREPDYRLMQLNCRGKRHYYFIDPEGRPRFFPSVTTILRNVMPENVNLTEWKLSMGKEAANAYTQERANYGTFLHGQLAELMITRRYNFDTLKEKLQKYVEREKLASSFVDNHEDEAKADIMAFAKWMQEYDVRPLAVEVSLYSETMRIAGMLDCVANMRAYPLEEEKKACAKLQEEYAKAGEDQKKIAKLNEKAETLKSKYAERVNGIVDFKSGKNGFYDEYAIQLELYRRMWNENFPDLQIGRIFNIAPKDWRKTVRKAVSFTFEEQTENPVLNKVDALLALYALTEESELKVVVIDGEVNLDNPDAEADSVKIFSLEELIKEKTPVVEEETNENLFD